MCISGKMRREREKEKKDSVLLFHHICTLGGRNYSCWSYFNRPYQKRIISKMEFPQGERNLSLNIYCFNLENFLNTY